MKYQSQSTCTGEFITAYVVIKAGSSLAVHLEKNGRGNDDKYDVSKCWKPLNNKDNKFFMYAGARKKEKKKRKHKTYAQ